MRFRIKSIQLLCGAALTLLVPTQAIADTRAVTPTGSFAQIDASVANEAIRSLSTGSQKEKETTINAVRATPENYAPPVFYALSSVLFDMGEKDDATFWFYVGQLRARFDANRCADSSARQAVSV